MADKEKNPWRSVDATGHDWNSGEDFDPTPAPSKTTQAAQQTAAGVGVAQTPQAAQQTPITTNAAAGGHSPAASSLPGSYSALQAEADRIAANNRVAHVDTSEQERMLADMRDTQTQQYNAQIDRGVTHGVNELARTREEALEQYQTTQNQIDLNERRSLDNQALYAAARGDRGGIGAEQYNSIQNAAMQNRVTVNNARTKMTTDIDRQIAELRANGEFEKANAAMSVTLQYQQQLMQLYQWAQEFNASVDQFNAQLDQWAANYKYELEKLGLQASQFEWQKAVDERNYNRSVFENDRAYERGVLESDRAYERGVLESDRAYDFQVQAYRDQLEQQALENGWRQQEVDLQVKAYEDGLRQQQWQNSITERQLAAQESQQRSNSGWTKLSNGIMPSAEERAAMGNMSEEEARLKVSIFRSQEALGISSAELGLESARLGNEATRAGIEATKANTEATRTNTEAAKASMSALTSGGTGSFDDRTTALFQDAKASGNPQSYITNNYKRYGLTSSSGLYADYKNWASGASGGGMSFEDAKAEALAGRWSDKVYQGLLDGGMSAADIQRSFGKDGDEYDSSNFNDYIENGYMNKIRSMSRAQIGDNANPMSTSMYQGYRNAIGKTLGSSGIEAAQVKVNQIWNKLSYKQRIDLIEYLYKNGMELSFE